MIERKQMRWSVALLGVLALAAIAFLKQNDPLQPAISALRVWAGDTQVLAAIQAQNRLSGGWSREELDRRDRQWVRERKMGAGQTLIPLISSSPLSRKLAAAAQARQIEQIMVMDAKGALVAASNVTHDYNQSDEPKWMETFAVRREAPLLEGVDPDGVAQISLTVWDRGQPIGAVTLRWRTRP